MPLQEPDLPPIGSNGTDYGTQPVDQYGYPVTGGYGGDPNPVYSGPHNDPYGIDPTRIGEGPIVQINPDDPNAYGATLGPDRTPPGGYAAPGTPGGHGWRPNPLLGGPLGMVAQIIRHAIEGRVHSNHIDRNARGSNPNAGPNLSYPNAQGPSGTHWDYGRGQYVANDYAGGAQFDSHAENLMNVWNASREWGQVHRLNLSNDTGHTIYDPFNGNTAMRTAAMRRNGWGQTGLNAYGYNPSGNQPFGQSIQGYNNAVLRWQLANGQLTQEQFDQRMAAASGIPQAPTPGTISNPPADPVFGGHG